MAAATVAIVRGVAATTTFHVATATNATGAGAARSSDHGDAVDGWRWRWRWWRRRRNDPRSAHGYTSTIKMNFNYAPGIGQQIVQTSHEDVADGYHGGHVHDAARRSPVEPVPAALGHHRQRPEQRGIHRRAVDLAVLNDAWDMGQRRQRGSRAGLLSASWSFTSFPLKPNTQYFLNIMGDSPLSVKLTASKPPHVRWFAKPCASGSFDFLFRNRHVTPLSPLPSSASLHLRLRARPRPTCRRTSSCSRAA